MSFGNRSNVGVCVAIAVALVIAVPVTVTLGTAEAAGVDYYLMTFDSLPSDEVRIEFSEQYGLEFLEYRQDNTYLARVPVSKTSVAASLPGVGAFVKYSAAEKVSPELKSAKGNTDLRVNVHAGADVESSAAILSSWGVEVTRTCSVVVNYLECQADASVIDKIAGLRDVYSVQRNGEKQTYMNYIQTATYIGNDVAQTAGFTGSGMLAQVQDNGCDADIVVGAGNGHQDLDNIIYTDGAAVSDDHGTCTSGIVFGNGAGDANAQGIAYEAIGSFADWATGRTVSVQNLWNGDFNQGMAGMNGVMQSNSWSQGTLDGTYTAYTNEDDQAAVTYPNVLTLWAAGNSNSGTGVGLITQDSANKNGMCIGAIFHQNTASMADDDYHDAGAGMTPSRGPAADGRMKPDLIAAFDWIYTTDMIGASGYVAGDYYDDFGGTSGATPTVAGSALQAYEMFQENFFDNNPANAIPYSATIKALMIADAYQYPLGVNAITRNVEGWGTPDMENMYNRGATYHVIEEHPQALAGGDVWSRAVYSDGSMSLKISLAWTDPAAPATTGSGRALINNLDLRVVSPGGTVYWGNNGLWSNLWSTPGTGINDWSRAGSYTDDENNVENVFIQNPAVGLWTVEVSGRAGDVAQGPQHFSVVASGAQSISGIGTISLDQEKYLLESMAQLTVQDLDINMDPLAVESVNVNIASSTEPAGETRMLTETGPDTSTFVGTVMLSATNSVGVLMVVHGDIVTATYNDADAGGTGPATVIDTAIVDGSPPGQPAGLTVEWYGLVQQPFFLEDFEGDGSPTFAELGWTAGGASNDWQIGTPAGLGTPPDPTGAYGGTFSIGNDLTGLGTYPGEYEDGIAAESNYVYSAPIDCTGYTDVQLQFARYLGVETSTYDRANVEASTSTSGPWTTIWTNSATISDTAWSVVTYDISAIADNQPAVYVRFELGPTDGSVTYCGWNIDDLALLGLTSGTMHNTVNWTLSADDGAGADDVDHYNIYRSNQQTGPWDATTLIDTLPAGTNTYTDPDRGEFDGINWWYVIRAVDDIGNMDMNTIAVPEVPLINVPPSAPTNPTPANGAVAVPVNTVLSVRAADPNGDPLTVSFYNAAGPTLIGTNLNVPSGTYTTMPWNGLSPSTTYSWYAIAYDGEFTTPSSTWSFTTTDTTPPGPVTGLTVAWTGTTSGDALNEDFAGGIPTSWTVVDGGSGGGSAATWTTANPGGRAATAPITTPFAIVDSDYAGSSATQDEQLITPVMNLASATSATLQFDHYFYRYQTEVCDVDVRSSNTGGAWTNVYTRTGSSTPNPEHQTINITTQAAGASDAQVRFRYYAASYEWYWMVDNVVVSFVGGATTDDNLLNWVLSADDGAGVGDVANYNIYRATTSAGPWDSGALVTSVAAGVSTYTDLGRGEFDGTNWWYVVRAEDVWGNEETNTAAVPEIAGAAAWFNITVAAGWNLVSVPILGPTTMPTALLDKTGGVVWTRAMWYDPSTPADPWKQYNSAWVSSLNDLTAVGNTLGVWLFVTTVGDGQICVGGAGYSTPSSTGILLKTGWNLVGFPSDDATYTVGNLKTDVASVTLVEQYDGAQTYRTSVMADAAAFVPGRAYWVYNSGGDVTWNKAW